MTVRMTTTQAQLLAAIKATRDVGIPERNGFNSSAMMALQRLGYIEKRDPRTVRSPEPGWRWYATEKGKAFR